MSLHPFSHLVSVNRLFLQHWSYALVEIVSEKEQRVKRHSCLQVNKLDWIVFNAALFGVMFAGVEIGMAIAIGTSIVLAILKVAFPRTAILGSLPGTNVYR